MSMTKLYESDGDLINVTNVYDVTLYGAVGDGVTDDSSAIQSALDACGDGGMVFFPTGTYLIKTALKVYSNQIIELNGSTILQGDSINNLMRGYCTSSIGSYNGPHNIIIQNGTFDGGSYTTNNTLLGFCHSKNIIIRNCTFKNAYGTWHNIEINSSKHVLIENCSFEASRRTGENAEMIQIDSYDSAATWPWGDGAQDNTISYMIEIKGCHFYSNTVSPAVGNHSSTNIEYVRIHDCTFEGLTSSRAAIGFQSGKYVDIYDNTFVDCTTICNDRSQTYWTCHDNRIDGATSIGGFASKYNNIVDGTLSS